jgi:putative ABC transport system substrate-binding protein
MRRREFITLLGGTVASWPLAANAQRSGVPVIGFLHSASWSYIERFAKPVRQGLNEVGYAAT